MAGLLDGFSEFIKTPEGQGLLAATFGGLAGAQRGAPLNSLGRAGLAGLSGYGGALDRQDKKTQETEAKRLRDLQINQAQLQIDSATRAADIEKWKQDAAKRFVIPGVSATPAEEQKPLNIASDTGPNLFSPSVSNMATPGKPATAATPSRFDFEGYANALAEKDAAGSIALRQALQKDNTPVVVPQGGSLYSKNGTFLAMGSPKEESTDPKIKQYEYALKNGYKDSFEKFVTLGPALMAAAAAPLRDAQVGNIVQENAYNLPPPRTAPAAQPRAPMKGQVVQGYRFKGGNPADQNNWEKK